jgi:hypothetical protein
MSIPSWPETLPDELFVSGYGHSLADTTITSEMDAGPAKVRRRFTAGVEPISGTMILSETELGYLETFYDTTTLSGAIRFTWTKPPAHSEECEMRFTQAPSWTKVEDQYEVSLSLEILP